MAKPLRKLFKPRPQPRQEPEPQDESRVEPLPRNQVREVPSSDELSVLAMSELAASSPRGETGRSLSIAESSLNALLNT